MLSVPKDYIIELVVMEATTAITATIVCRELGMQMVELEGDQYSSGGTNVVERWKKLQNVWSIGLERKDCLRAYIYMINSAFEPCETLRILTYHHIPQLDIMHIHRKKTF